MWGWDGWWGGPLGNLWHLIMSIFWGAAQLLALLVFVGVLILLVRFLLVGTRAAQLYIARHSPADTASSTPGAATTTPPAASTATRAPTTRTTPTTRPAASPTARTTKRTPKPPAPPAT